MASKVESRSVNIFINGQQANSTLKEMESHSRKLRNELSRLVPGTEAFKNKMAELKSVNKQLNSIKDDIKGVGGAFGWLKTEIGKLGVLAAGYLGFQFVTSQFRDIISQNGKLSDSLADVRRVASLTGSEALELNKRLGKIDTRTSVASLRDLAIIAGKLGVAKGDIAGFTESVDMLVVTLGDELGNADQITTELGKILNVFEGEITADNILHIGNAMVGLANSGVATGGFIADFTQQVSGIAKTANMSLPATMGFGAAMEELGQRAESSATALQKLLTTIGQDIPAAAKIAGMSKETFEDLFGKKPEEALLRYAAGLTKNKQSFAEITSEFKSAGQDGARVIGVLSQLGLKTDFIRSKMSETGELYLETTAVTNGFALKNETLGATLEKLGKQFNRLTTNNTLVGLLTSIVMHTSSAVQWIDKNIGAITSTIKILAVAASAWLTYRVALSIATSEKKLWIKTLFTAQTLEKLDIITTTSLGLAKAILTGNVKKARQEWLLLNAVMGTNPYALVAAGIAALGVAMYLYSKRLTEAQRIQMSLNEISAEASKSAAEEKNRINFLVAAIKNENTGLGQKIAAVNKLRDIMPEYLAAYTTEEILAGKATESVAKYISMLEKKARTEAGIQKITSLDAKTTDIDQKLADGYKGSTIWDRLKAGANATQGKSTSQVYLQGLKDERTQIEKEKEAIRAAMQADLEKPAFTPDGQKPGGASAGGGTKGQDKGIESAAEKAKKIAEDLHAELQKIGEEIYKDGLDKSDQEVYAIQQKYIKLRSEAAGNKDDIVKINELEGKEVQALIKKQTDADIKLAKEKSEELLQERIEASQRLFEAGMDDRQLEQLAIDKHYEELIAMADKFGFDTTELFEKWTMAKIAIETKAANGGKTPEQLAKEEEQRIEDKNNFIIESAQQVSNSLFNILANSSRAESDARISALNNKREQELRNKELTEVQKNAINAKYDEQIRNEKIRGWRAEQQAAIAQALINGALAVTKVLAQTGVLAPFVIPAIAIATAAQVALIVAQKVPQFEHGGYSAVDYSEPEGYVKRPTLFARSASGRPFIAGEKYKSEYIISSQQLKDPVIADFVGMMEGRRGIAQFEQGGYSSGAQAGKKSKDSESSSLMLQLMKEMISAQKSANNKKIVLVYKDFERLQDDMASINYSTDS